MISRHALLHRYYLFDALMRVAMAINGDSCLLVLKTAVFQEKQSYLLNFTDKCEDGTCRIKDEIDEEYKIKGGGCKTAVYPQEELLDQSGSILTIEPLFFDKRPF